MVGPTIAQRRMYENPQKNGRWFGCSRPIFIGLIVVALLGLTWYWFRPEEVQGPRKSRSGAEFGDIWDARMGATEDEGEGNPASAAPKDIFGEGSLNSDPRKLLQGRRTLTKIDDWDYGDLPEKDTKPLDLRKGVSSLTFPFVVAQYRDRDATPLGGLNVGSRSQYFKPIRFVLPFWHPDATQAITTGAPLEPTSELRFHHQTLIEMLNLYTQQLGITSDSKNIMKQFPIVVDVGSCLGQLPLVAASMGLRSIVYEPVFLNAEKIRMSVAFNGFEELVTVIEAAASDEIGEMEIAVPSDPKQLCSCSTSLENIPGAVTFTPSPPSSSSSYSANPSPVDPNSPPSSFSSTPSSSSSSTTISSSTLLPTINQETHSWLGVQMLRIDYSVEWLNLIDDILVLHISVQGFEKQVLKGASNLFKTGRVHNVIHDFWPAGIEHSGSEPLGVLLNLEDLGFQLKTLKDATPFETEREYKRLAELGNEKVTLHWIRKQK